MGRISPGPTRWPPGAKRRLVPAKSNLKPQTSNPIAGPRTGTTRSEPSAPASAGASGRHNEPGSRPASACPAQPPSKAWAGSPRAWGKAPRRRESRPEHRERPDRTRRGAPRGATRHGKEAHRRPQPRHTDRCQATTAAGCCKPGERAQHATNHGRTGAKQHQPPSGRTSARPAANQAPARYGTAAVRMDVCAPEGYPARAGYKRAPSRRTCARLEGTQPLPATNSYRPDGRVSAPQRRPAHATPSTTHRAGTPVNRSQVAQDTAHASQHTERTNR